MKPITFYAIVCLTAAAGIVSSLYADESPTLGISLDYNSKYVWRGQIVTDDSVFQPCVEGGYKNFTGGIWGNMDLTDDTDDEFEKQFTEIDYYLGYSNTVPGVEMLEYSLGVCSYTFPNLLESISANDSSAGQPSATTEVSFGLALDTILQPSVTFNYDIDDISGYYLQLSAGHTFEKLIDTKEMNLALDLSVSVALADSNYNEGYWGVDHTALNDLVLSAGLPFSFSNGITITPSVNYVLILDDEIADDVDDAGGDYSFVYFGIGASVSF